MLSVQFYNHPAFGSTSTDSDNDHWLFVGNKNIGNGKENWRIQHERDGNIFRIINVRWNGPLFCSDNTVADGDHRTFVSNNPNYERNTTKCLWRIEKYGANYKIFSVKYGGALYAGDGVDGAGEHWCWVSPNADYNTRNKPLWSLVPTP